MSQTLSFPPRALFGFPCGPSRPCCRPLLCPLLFCPGVGVRFRLPSVGWCFPKKRGTGWGPLGVYAPHAACVYALPRASLGLPCVWGVERDHRATPTERGSHGNGLVVVFWWSSNLFGQSSEVVFGHHHQRLHRRQVSATKADPCVPSLPRASPECVPGRDRSGWAGVGHGRQRGVVADGGLHGKFLTLRRRWRRRRRNKR